MRIVLDTNLHVSALIQKEGTPAQVLRLWREGKIELAVSIGILDEIYDVLHRPHIKDKYGLSDEEIAAYMRLLQYHSLLVEPKIKLSVVKDDPDDNMIIECALDAEADYIVSGDKHLLGLKEYEGIKIVQAMEFMKLFEQL